VFKGWEQVTPGSMTPLQYDQPLVIWWLHAVDGRASPEHRVRVGVWVLLFLGVFTVIAWRLNAAFWKDVK
jgi:ubiquinol-cytochrome c reductase cytochrome c1 subunit